MLYSTSMKQNHLFRKLYAKGKSRADKNLVLYCRPNGRQGNRIGYTVSTKLGHAVVRNRLRRQFREIYRLHETAFRPGYDLVFVVRSHAITATYAELTESVLSLAEALGLSPDGGNRS